MPANTKFCKGLRSNSRCDSSNDARPEDVVGLHIDGERRQPGCRDFLRHGALVTRTFDRTTAVTLFACAVKGRCSRAEQRAIGAWSVQYG